MTRWETRHPAWKLSARFEQPGFVANRRDGKGAALVARTLDELAAMVEAAEDAEFSDVACPGAGDEGTVTG